MKCASETKALGALESKGKMEIMHKLKLIFITNSRNGNVTETILLKK